jgi:hypothetical protein
MSTTPLQPTTTSHNNPEYQAAPAGAEQALAAAPPERAGGPAVPAPPPGSPPAARATGGQAPREPASKYALLAPPNYETIVGGIAPSPIVSLLLTIGLLGLLGAAVAAGLGVSSAEWWVLGALFTIVATMLAGFISRSA